MPVTYFKYSYQSKKIMYLLVGGINTIFGYFTGVAVYYIMYDRYGILAVAAVANVISITFSFVLYKLLVFKTTGNVILEYLKSYIVYGFSALIGTGLLFLFIETIGINIWVAQMSAIALTVIISYIGHNTYTFSGK